MNWELVGDLFICCSIIGSIVLFTVVNVNYDAEAAKNDLEE